MAIQSSSVLRLLGVLGIFPDLPEWASPFLFRQLYHGSAVIAMTGSGVGCLVGARDQCPPPTRTSHNGTRILIPGYRTMEFHDVCGGRSHVWYFKRDLESGIRPFVLYQGLRNGCCLTLYERPLDVEFSEPGQQIAELSSRPLVRFARLRLRAFLRERVTLPYYDRRDYRASDPPGP